METDDSAETAELRKELTKYREEHSQLISRFDELTQQLKKKKIKTFEDLAEQDQQAKRALVQLAQTTEPVKMQGSNVGFFGLTSTGKSTMLNALLGQKVAETGVGETTTKITPYKGTRFTLWDVPGRNDEVSYLSMKYISFFKGLSRRLILIQATVRENSSMIKLLDEVGLRYDIVFNKFDKVEEDEQNEIKKQIRSEVEKLGLRGVNKIYFVSAKNPQMFDDWLLMVDNLTK
jgi:small GTP-binding protein